MFEPIAPEAAGMPLYRVVKRALLRAVASGACAPGSALPSESELAASLAVSIGTLRKAVDELAAEHIVVRRQGRGTFVATHTADRQLLQFFALERDDGRREAPRVEWLSLERGRAAGSAARALALRDGEPVLLIENSVWLQGEAVLHERLTLPAALFKGLSEKRLHDWPSTLYQLYQAEFGVTVVRALERVRAIGADRAAARVLGLAPGAPVLQVRRAALSFGDQPVEYRVSIINTAHHEYLNEPARAASGVPQ
ncbi:MAG TPA: GntR family transcriptional regulator [Albitalea sp.]|nr:GntR family transcriptional regulator [Albitalea sp.]